MIVLSNSGQIYRYLNRYRMETPTDLCQLTWKLALSIILLIALGVLCGAYIIGWFAIFLLSSHWTVVLTVAVTVFGVFMIAIFGGGYIFSREPVEELCALITEQYRGFKEKYCPLVTFK